MAKKILLLGHTGKMGTAIKEVFADGYTVTGLSSKDFDAMNFEDVQDTISRHSPDILINTAAFLGIDPCEKEPERAFRMNALYPKALSELSNKMGFLLVHFSTDAVFNDSKGDFCTEGDTPCPLNVYGATKYAGDCFIQALAGRFYIFRVSVLFGKTPKDNQFVEKMLQKAREGQKTLRISGDIISSPTYSKDVAAEVKRIVEAPMPHGVYHIANEGKASLYELMKEITETLGLDVKVEKASYRDFPYVGIKNTNTPLKSIKINALRPWKEAVREYCREI
ncbi:MAG: NAD(P)-dependent oxidoreductase [Thermodesulfovibrionales bacterium]|nr:NAD(P)-dependent oxidoreductase [Thermodesulfovibrionales bacterium]